VSFRASQVVQMESCHKLVIRGRLKRRKLGHVKWGAAMETMLQMSSASSRSMYTVKRMQYELSFFTAGGRREEFRRAATSMDTCTI
jgi:hypothetical protein